MSLTKAYRNLSPRTKLGLGIGLLAWGVGGLWMTDRVEEKLGLTPSEQDKAQLDDLKPMVHAVSKAQRS